jgi:hypothetical protein
LCDARGVGCSCTPMICRHTDVTPKIAGPANDGSGDRALSALTNGGDIVNEAFDKYLMDTKDHIEAVQDWLYIALGMLQVRATKHDASKLREPEMSGFMAMMADARLKDLTYGSEEYRKVLAEHEGTVNLHYSRNDHHPEYWAIADPGDEMAQPFYDKTLAANGYAMRQMNLIALLEMLADWMASTGRMKDGDIMRSIDINAQRFGYGPEITALLKNTARVLTEHRPEQWT